MTTSLGSRRAISTRNSGKSRNHILSLSVGDGFLSRINFRSALRKNDAALALFESANTSYSASLDAYNSGVRNLVDVVTAEKQLAQARLSGVSARSQLFLEAVNLEFVTGNLLRSLPAATSLQAPQVPQGQVK